MVRDYDLIVFGATGFTGRLVAEYLVRRRQPLRMALAGRNRDKLNLIAAALGGLDVLVADALDPAQCAAIAGRTRVVCTTVGPYGKFGSEIVAACAAAGTHYCDLTGEVPWMRRMIDAHHARAAASGARIVHACGFDSIPSDLGAWCAQEACFARHGRYAQRITALYSELAGGISGGTAASMVSIAEQADRETRRLLRNPYALDPDPTAPRPAAPDVYRVTRELGHYTFPFVMAASNTRVVRRSHALAGLPWGPSFVYDEKMAAPATAAGFAVAAGVTAGLGVLAAAMSSKLVRPLVAKLLPQSGDGPAQKTREHGHWRVDLHSDLGDVYTLSDRADPGYGSTSKMLGEAALCLAQDALTSPPGVVTPAFAMGEHLAERLRSAGLTLAPAE